MCLACRSRCLTQPFIRLVHAFAFMPSSSARWRSGSDSFDMHMLQAMPASAYMYALPYEYFEKFHVRKYGFHGTSVKYLVGQVREYLTTLSSAPVHLCTHL